MKSWFDTVRSLFLGRWWWFPSVFFAPWGLSAFLLFLIALALPFSVRTGGSNGVLLCAAALTGVWAGLWARRLHGWECAVLVPDLPRRLLVLPVVLVVGAAVVFAAFSIHAGNPFPAMGPALLVGVGAVYCLVRLPEWAMPLASAVCVWLLLAWVVGGPVHLPALSHPAVQALAVALAVAVLAILKRGLEAPVDEPPSSAVPGQTLTGTSWDTSGKVKRLCRLALFGFVLDTLIRLLADHPSLPFLGEVHEASSGYDGLLFTSGMIIACPSILMRVNPYPAAWLMGEGRTRTRLAWSLVGRMVLTGLLPLFAFFLAVETVQVLLGRGDPRFDVLLMAQTLAFLAFGIEYAFRRKYPTHRFLAHASMLVWMHLWFLGPDLFSWLDPGLPVLALLVAGSAAAAVGVVSHGLARARYLL